MANLKPFENPNDVITGGIAEEQERLRAQAIKTGMPLIRLRKMVSFERLLARLVSGKEEVWILKGGFALELRLGIRARTTNDLDLLATR